MKTKPSIKVSTGRPGRPREFDIDVATRDAMEVFWQSGFHATSLPDLIEGTGLTRGSIYKAYEDKRSIYLAALDVYIEGRIAEIEKALKRSDPRAAIKEMFRISGRDAASERGRKGDFTIAATVEMVPNDAEIEDRLGSMLSEIEAMLVRTIDQGKKDGGIATKTASKDIAKFLICTVQGMCVGGKFGPTERANGKLAAMAMAILD